MKYLFTNLSGSFVFDEKLKLVEEIQFKRIEDYQNKIKTENQLQKKHSGLSRLPPEKLSSVLGLFKDPKYFSEFYLKNLKLTKEAVKKSVSEDNLITQAVANINELDKVVNLLVKRLREWYGLYLPEFERYLLHPGKYVELILEKSKDELIKEMKIKETMGADLEGYHLQEIKELAKRIKELQQLREKHEQYLEKIMEKYCPNLLELGGVTIGAKLIELGKSLKHLAMLPASTIQLLGAEKALFRHIKTGSKSPKYGIIFQHPLIQKSSHDKQGKAARMLADKLSLCARLDYFKGEFKAKGYRKELEEKFR